MFQKWVFKINRNFGLEKKTHGLFALRIHWTSESLFSVQTCYIKSVS